MTKEKLLEQAQRLLEEGNGEAARELVAALAEQGDASALGIIGVVHFLGVGCPPDGALAVEYLTRAADAGDALAAHNLASLYFGGMPGVAADPGRARALYALSRELGSTLTPPDFPPADPEPNDS